MRELSSCLKTVGIVCALCLVLTCAVDARAAAINVGDYDDLLQAAEQAGNGDSLDLTANITLGGDISLKDGVTVRSSGGPFTLKSAYNYQPKYGFGVARGATAVFDNVNIDETSVYVDLGDAATDAGKIKLTGT